MPAQCAVWAEAARSRTRVTGYGVVHFHYILYVHPRYIAEMEVSLLPDTASWKPLGPKKHFDSCAVRPLILRLALETSIDNPMIRTRLITLIKNPLPFPSHSCCCAMQCEVGNLVINCGCLKLYVDTLPSRYAWHNLSESEGRENSLLNDTQSTAEMRVRPYRRLGAYSQAPTLAITFCTGY